jgi:predicted nucleic acid-binding protein
MPIYFFDTSALKHRYINTKPHAQRIGWLVSNAKCECYVADWTVLEVASALAGCCRDRRAGVNKFDSMDRLFFRDMASGRIKVRPTNSRDILRARSLLRKGVMIHRRVDSGDALIAACCRDLALERRQRITFYTSDWGLYTVLREIGAFTSVLKLRFVGAPKHGIPAET